MNVLACVCMHVRAYFSCVRIDFCLFNVHVQTCVHFLLCVHMVCHLRPVFADMLNPVTSPRGPSELCYPLIRCSQSKRVLYE